LSSPASCAPRATCRSHPDPYPRRTTGQLYVRLEDALLLIGGNAGAGVAEFDTPPSLCVEHASVCTSLSHIAHVLHRVAHEVQGHTRQHAAAARDVALRDRRERESDPAILRLQCQTIDQI